MSDHNGTQSDQPNGTNCVAFGYSGHLEDRTDDKRIIAALQQLKPSASVKGHLTHDWAKDPFAQGTWLCASPGMTTKYFDELQKPHGRDHVASADWADGWRGFVDGAVEQGRRAAMHAAKALKAETSAVNDQH